MKPPAKARRNARGRLLRYLLRGGRLVEDTIAYARATRSGEVYPKPMVERMLDTGVTKDGQIYQLIQSGLDKTLYLCPVGDE